MDDDTSSPWVYVGTVDDSLLQLLHVPVGDRCRKSKLLGKNLRNISHVVIPDLFANSLYPLEITTLYHIKLGL